MNEHIQDLAELYALGALDDEQQLQVDEHVSSCTVCAAAIGSAEAAVAAMISPAEPPGTLDRRMRTAFKRTPAFMQWPALAAAILVVGLVSGFSFWSAGNSARKFDANRELAVRSMVASHFAHAQFVSKVPNAPKAKLVYARTGAWVYAIAQTNRPLTLAAVSDGRTVTLGTLNVAGNAAELFVANPHARQFLLKDESGNVLASCTTTPARAP